MVKRPPIRKSKIIEDSEECFRAEYKGHIFEIEKEEAVLDEYGSMESEGGFYIFVTELDGSTCYDGWWGDSSNTMDQAIIQACKGSLVSLPDNLEAA